MVESLVIIIDRRPKGRNNENIPHGAPEAIILDNYIFLVHAAFYFYEIILLKRRIFRSEVVYIFINIIYDTDKKHEYKFFFSKEDFMEGK